MVVEPHNVFPYCTKYQISWQVTVGYSVALINVW